MYPEETDGGQIFHESFSFPIPVGKYRATVRKEKLIFYVVCLPLNDVHHGNGLGRHMYVVEIYNTGVLFEVDVYFSNGKCFFIYLGYFSVQENGYGGCCVEKVRENIGRLGVHDDSGFQPKRGKVVHQRPSSVH